MFLKELTYLFLQAEVSKVVCRTADLKRQIVDILKKSGMVHNSRIAGILAERFHGYM